MKNQKYEIVQREMVPNKKYKNVIFEGCKMVWIRLVQKPVLFVKKEK